LRYIVINQRDLIKNTTDVISNGGETLYGDPDCPIEPKFFEFNDKKENNITSTLYVPILVTSRGNFIGNHDSSCSGETIYQSGEVTGVCESKLSQVTTYSAENPIGVNFSQPPFFSGVLGVNGDTIRYVLGGEFNGGYVEGTGIIYTTNKSTSETTFYLNLSFFPITTDKCLIKSKTEITEIINNAFIDRTPNVSPNELLMTLMDMKNKLDFETKYTIKKNY
jgi:hypothetical protein